MSIPAPLRVPVELRAGARWFRLAVTVSDRGLLLGQAVPEEIEGAFEVRFPLPDETNPIRCRAQAGEVVVGEGDEEHAERRALHFLDLTESDRSRIEAYVQERLGLLR
jgi:hypothetical protein